MPKHATAFCSLWARALAVLVMVGAFGVSKGAAQQQMTPQGPSAAQPNLPRDDQAPLPTAGSPVVDDITQGKQPSFRARRSAPARIGRIRPETKRRHAARRHEPFRDLERPALSGVELVNPLPPPGEPPHFTVPVSSYPLDSLAALYFTPPPPIVCHPTRRDRTQPDPRLLKEAPVVCEPDNP